MSLSHAAESLQYIKVPVTATVSGSVHNPTADVVTMAFMDDLDADPDAGDFVSADWETIGTNYYARCLIGPGGTVELAVNLYAVWVKITDSPEIPVIRAGVLRIY